MNTLLLAIIGHLVGDYLLQNDWMALNKKKPGHIGTAACMLHALLWSISVTMFSGWWRVYWTQPALFALHYWQDRTNFVLWWMTKVNRQKQFAEGPCAPWSVIVVDNVWHILSLYVVARALNWSTS